MGASASVIQEYYKAVDYWADIVGNRDWKPVSYTHLTLPTTPYV